eukprot:gene11064-11220_t
MDGWDYLIQSQDCSQLLAASASQPGLNPAYCSWYGVSCCDQVLISANKCSTEFSVLDLRLQSNQLSGGIDDPDFINSVTQLHACGLTSIDLEGNDLSGILTDEWGILVNLVMLNLANNWISGTVAAGLQNLTQLVELSLDRNSFCGTLPEWLGDLHSLQILRIGANSGFCSGCFGICGAVPQSLANLQQLNLLMLGPSPELEGSLPADLCHDNTALETLLINGCKLTGTVSQFLRLSGTLHPFLSLILTLSMLHLSGNQLSGTIDDDVWYLPRLTSIDLSHNHLIGSISPAIGDTPSLVELMLEGNQLTGPIPPRIGYLPNLGDYATSIADLPVTSQVWNVDPSYYHYTGCKCLEGYFEVWSSNGARLSCEKNRPVGVPSWLTPLIAGMGVLGLLLLAVASLLIWFRMAVRLKRRWQREKELNKHRQLGLPSGCPASIVVTDVENYSDLVRLNGPLTAQALGAHNFILRQAASDHAGHVIEQEGDSWSVAFHSHVEAVAFCLQVQQALQKCNWPPQLTSLLRKLAAGHTDLPDSLVTSRVASESVQTRASSYSTNPANSGVSVTTSASPAPTTSAPSDTAQTSSSLLIGVNETPQQPHTKKPKHKDIIKGLRVRMGVATGHVPADAAITRSALFQLAKGVSDIANGGQVLLDEATCDAIRDRLPELGCIDHKGFNDKLLGSTAAVPQGMQQLTNRISRCQLWKGKLNLKSELEQVAKGYFDAPGASAALLVAGMRVERPLLAAVTTVFATVEGGKLLVRMKPQVAKATHRVLEKVMQALLLSMPDGYLCRAQEAVLKYILAFREPARAAEWCLMLQVVLQDLPWPAELLEGFEAMQNHSTSSMPGAKQAKSWGGGVQPKLKIALAEGIPDSIEPDHLGHADYFGNNVNLTARMMDAAAHGGQVVTSCTLANGIFTTWRHEAELGLYELATADMAQHPTNSLSSVQWQALSVSGITSDKTPSSTVSAPLLSAGVPETPAASSLAAPASEKETPKGSAILQGDDDMPRPAVRVALISADAASSSNGSSEAGLTTSAGHPVSGPRLLHGPADGGRSKQYQSQLVHVSAFHVGRYAFKGCVDPVDVVSLTTPALAAQYQLISSATNKGAKGMLILPVSGPVLGLQDCPVVLTLDVMAALRQACTANP